MIEVMKAVQSLPSLGCFRASHFPTWQILNCDGLDEMTKRNRKDDGGGREGEEEEDEEESKKG